MIPIENLQAYSPSFSFITHHPLILRQMRYIELVSYDRQFRYLRCSQQCWDPGYLHNA